MKPIEKKIIRDKLAQLMLQAAISLAYQQGLYPNTQDFGAKKSRAELAEEKRDLLLQNIINHFHDSFQPEVAKKLNGLLTEIKKFNSTDLTKYIDNLNRSLATNHSPQEVIEIFDDSDLEKTANDDSKKYAEPPKQTQGPKHLVLSGGGIKGVAYETVFETLENNGLLQEIDYCYGSSVGGLSAALLALGYSVEETKKNMDVNKKMLLDPYRHEHVSPLASAKYMVKNLFNHAAIAKGYKLYELSQNVVAQKLGDPNATFADLEKRFGQQTEDGGKFRHLTVTATVKDPRRGFYQVVLNAETVPNMPIALAMRMTAGLPPAFRGVELTPEELEHFRQGATKPLVQYPRGENFPPYDPNNPHDDIPVTAKKRNAIKFIDGGVTDNLPIYLPLQNGAKLNEVLALNFADPWRVKHREKNQKKFSASKNINTEVEKNWINTKELKENDYFYYLYQRKRYPHSPALPPAHLVKAEQANAVINIPTDDVKAADFDLPEERKNILRANGKDAAESYLRKIGIEPKDQVQKVNQKEILELHQKHQDVLRNAKDLLSKKFDLHNNSDYLNFEKHVDKASKELTIEKGIITQRVKMAKMNFTEIYKMRNEVSDAFSRAKKEVNLAQRCLYGLWEAIPVIKTIVKKVDKNLHNQFEKFNDFKAVAKGLNGALKAQRVAGMEISHKKYSPYKDHLKKTITSIKNTVSKKDSYVIAKVKKSK